MRAHVLTPTPAVQHEHTKSPTDAEMQMFADFHQDVSPRNSVFDAMARPDQRCTHGQREQFILRMLLR